MHFELTDEQKMLREMVRNFAENEVEPTAKERDEEARFDREIFDQMAELGLTGIPWPEKYGGIGSDYVSYVIAVEELSRVCASTGVTLSAHVSLASWPIFAYGNDTQKETYLTKLATGEALGAFALSEPGAGSDVASMQMTAKKVANKYVLNGTKVWITNGGEADIYVVFAKTDEQEAHRGISAFIVEKDAPGLSFGKTENKLGIRSSPTAEMIFDQCEIPEENLLGKEGEGFRIAMRTLDGGRSGIAAQAVGISQGALDHAVQYAKERKQFGRRIADHQAISFKLADMATEIEAARLLTYRAAWLESNGHDYGTASAMAKLYASDAAMRHTTEAVQIFGGYGYTKDYPVERFMRDAKITQIYEGTNEIQRLVIGRSVTK